MKISDIQVGMTLKHNGEEITVEETRTITHKKKSGPTKVKLRCVSNSSGKIINIIKPSDRDLDVVNTDDSTSVDAVDGSFDDKMEQGDSSDDSEESEDNEDSDEIDLSIVQSSADASLVEPVRCGELRKGHYMIIRDNPCKIMDIKIAKAGKHGEAKASITGRNIFTDKVHHVNSVPTQHNVYAPIVRKIQYELTDISEDGYLTLMDDLGEQNQDLGLPKNSVGELTEVALAIQQKFENLSNDKIINVTVLKSMDQKQVVDYSVSSY